MNFARLNPLSKFVIIWRSFRMGFYVCLCLGLNHGALHAAEAILNDVVVTNTRDDLLLYLNVDGAFHEKMERAVISGVPASFSFFVNLFSVRTLWPDKKLVDLKLIHTIKYNALKKEFTIIRSWEADREFVTPSYTEAKKRMAKINGLNIISLSQLEKGQRYQIRAKAQLSKVKLPLYLHYVLFFVSLWDFETDWYSIDFVF
jgi:hypothetical protein